MDPLSEARALLVLLRLPGVGDATVLRLERAFGSGRGALEAPGAAFADVAGPAGGRARRGREWAGIVERVARGLERCRELDVAVHVRGAPGYPERLLHLPDPPAVVLLRGRRELLDRPAVAVVGSRRSTSSGRRMAGEVARTLAGRGVVVASGLALGVDAAAHRAALEAGGDSLAVLGTGPDEPHPPSNRRLFGTLARDGLLVTEFLPGEPAFAHHFPRRNRLLAALAQGVLVVQAARRSGALITAGHALDLGRPVGAVPGSVYAPGSQGTNRLLRDGALPIVEPEDVFALVPDSLLSLAEGPAPRPSPAPGSDGPTPGRDSDRERLLASVGLEPRDVDSVARAAGLPVERALAGLTALELDGRVRREPGMRFLRGRT